MTRYFFHLEECGTYLPDLEGRELVPGGPDLRQLAVKEARFIMSSEVQAGRLCLSCRIEVRDEHETLMVVVPFKDALEVTGR